MKRTVAFILTAVLVLGMVPATVITAFAHGYGVAGNNQENQSLPNALGQTVPETIAVDGKLDDTGWRSDLWYDVDRGSGVWNTTTPDESNKTLNYRYQIRTDYNYFYTSAEISLPAGQTTARYTIFLSDAAPKKNEDAERGVTGGFIFEIDTNAAEKISVSAQVGYDEAYFENYADNVPHEDLQQDEHGWFVYTEDGKNKIYYLKNDQVTHNNGRTILSVEGQPGYASNNESAPSGTVTEYAAHKLEYTIKGDADTGYKISLEFRNRALDTYNTERTLRYYVSVGVPRAENINDDYTFDNLYHPPFSRSSNDMGISGIYPTFENWPGTGAQVNYSETYLDGTGTIPGAIKVDGVFDEAIWSGMTNYYTANGAYGNAQYKDTVYAKPFDNLVDLSTVGYNEKSDGNNWANLQFKYDVRTDAKYLYGAIYVYAKMDGGYDRTSVIFRIFNENNAQTHAINLSLTKDGKKNLNCQIDRAAPYQDGDKWEWSTETIPAEHFEYGRSVRGDYYTYEFRIPLEVIDNDEVAFKWTDTEGTESNSQLVTDNTSMDGMYYSITVGRKGADLSNQWSSCGIGQNNSSYTYDKNVSIRKKIDKINYVGNASESVNIDGKLDDAAWTAISGADLKFDYATRQNAKDKTQKYKNLIYNVKADRDYIYGAVYVVLNDGAQWDTTTGTGDTNKSLVRIAITPYQSAITDASGKQTRIVTFHLENGQEKCYSHVYDGSTFRSDELTNYGGLGEYVGADVEFQLKGNKVLVEFKINVDDLGLDLGMQSHDENGVYFAYHITAEDSALGGSSSATGSAISHPAIGSVGGYYDFVSSVSATNQLYATYSNVVTYGDVLESVEIDGNIEENLWDNMTHVDESNGIYKSDPFQGILIDYDYSIYVGNKYLYGAAVFEEEITEKTDSRFTIWFDNGIDERTSMPVAGNGNNTCEFEFYEWLTTYDAESQETLSVTELQYFVNHNYSFALYGDQYNGTNGTQMNDRWDDNPEANPDVYLVNGSEVSKKNGEHYKYVVKRINGKTYLEFMIDLDTVHCEPKDFRFYVCFEHKTKLSNYEALELYHPTPQAESEVFWLTHVNPDTTGGLDAAGVIFTDYTKYTSSVTIEGNIKYWTQIALKPNGNGGYTIMEIIPIHGDEATSRLLTKGDDYIYYALNAGSYYEATDNDARNPRASQATHSAKEWRINDTLIFDLDGKTFTNHTITKPIIIYKTASDDNGNHIHTGNIVTTNRHPSTQYTSAYPKMKEWQAGGYYSSYTVTRVRGQNSIEAKLDMRNKMMPNFLKYGNTSCWMHITSGTAEKLSYITPEGVNVDGSLGDYGWKGNGWINVSGDVNATNYKDSEGVDYKYQLRADHDYLYVAAVLDTAFAEGVSFKLWLKSANGSSYDNLYELAYGETTLDNVKGSVSHELQAASLTEEAVSGIGYSDGKLTYPYVINAYKNNGETKLGYGESAVFGYTKELVESSSDGIWVWEAYPTTYGFRYGNEHAVIASGDGVTVNNMVANADQTVVEFKIGIDEFNGENGFEYFIEVSDSNGTTFYPQIFSELESEFNYYDYNYPTEKWDSGRANSVSKADINVTGAMWLVDKYTPVVTLGAKISDNYTASDGSTGHKAIRMGALYTEEYIRKLPHNTTDADKTTDYWDVADVGIIMLPTAYIEAGGELKHTNTDTRSISAVNIVDWISDKKTGEGTNFADYENFVFYATVYGIPEGIELSFAAYIDYYNENGTDTYYDHAFVRSYSMIEQLVNENDNLPE